MYRREETTTSRLDSYRFRASSALLFTSVASDFVEKGLKNIARIYCPKENSKFREGRRWKFARNGLINGLGGGFKQRLSKNIYALEDRLIGADFIRKKRASHPFNY